MTRNSKSRRVTIGHVVLGLKIGGLERVVVNLVNGLRDSRYRCVVCCLEEGGQFLAEIERSASVIVLGKGHGIDWGCIRRLAEYFRRENVDILHTHNPSPHFYGLAAAMMAGVRLRVHTKHGRNDPSSGKGVVRNRVLSRFTDCIVPVSDDARDVALRIERVQPHKVRRIWNGVDTNRYLPPAQRGAQRVIGTVARLAPDKDQKTMLAAFKLVLEQLPDVRLMLVGGGPCEAELHEVAERLGINRSVDFLGPRLDVLELLHTFSVFTLSSVSEGISMTVLEAMAAGTPIVATNVGGCREIVNPPECGLLVPPRSPGLLATAYIELLGDPERRHQMGVAARARVVEHFSLQKMIYEYKQLYDSLLNSERV